MRNPKEDVEDLNEAAPFIRGGAGMKWGKAIPAGKGRPLFFRFGGRPWQAHIVGGIGLNLRSAYGTRECGGDIAVELVKSHIGQWKGFDIQFWGERMCL